MKHSTNPAIAFQRVYEATSTAYFVMKTLVTQEGTFYSDRFKKK